MPTGGLTGARTSVLQELLAGLVVFLVALPLCLGIALASGAPITAGLIAGVVGGVLVGLVSGSNTSVAGPAAGLTAVVAAQIAQLGSFEAFLLAVVLAGAMQIALGAARAGFLAEFVPSSVIKGLLAAIGVILVLKQIPHLFGHDTDAEGDMSFMQPDQENTFSELVEIFGDLHEGAIVIGLVSLAILFMWERSKHLQRSLVPGPLVVVIVGVAMVMLFDGWGTPWRVNPSHRVAVPLITSLQDARSLFILPQWQRIGESAIWLSAITIALVASLETLLNVEAVDRIDPLRRVTPPSRELVAQGLGNIACGLVGGLPVTSVIIRSSVNIMAGGRTKLSAISHGVLLATCVAVAPKWLNQIPLSALAAILIMTGVKLASPKLFRQMWREGQQQFLPFAVTVAAIVLTDLLIGVLIGLGVSIAFILHSNLQRPLIRTVEKHVGGEVLRIELANQVSFLNRAALGRVLQEAPRGGQVLIDATRSDYIDADILDLIAEFRDEVAPVHGVELSLLGFKDQYRFEDRIRYVDFVSREVQGSLGPRDVLKMLEEGNERFRTGHQLTRNLTRQLDATAAGQFPLAAMLTCIDSRTPAELVFDLGLGDIFTVRIAGAIAKEKVLGSLEYACSVAGAKLIVVMGHTRCGAVGAAVDFHQRHVTAREAVDCDHIDALLAELQAPIKASPPPADLTPRQREAYVDRIAEASVVNTIHIIRSRSRKLRELEELGRIAIVGAMYEVQSGLVHWIEVLDGSGETTVALAAQS